VLSHEKEKQMEIEILIASIIFFFQINKRLARNSRYQSVS
jgi:hypothetical protein